MLDGDFPFRSFYPHCQAMPATSRPTIIVIVLVLLAAWLTWYFTRNAVPPLTIHSAEIQPGAATQDFDKFHLDDFSLTEQEGNVPVFALSARQLTHRKRKSKFFIYQNLKEIYLCDARITIFPPNKMIHEKITDEKPLEIPFEMIGKSFKSLGSPLTSIEEYLAGNSDINLDIVSRVLFDAVSVQIALQDNKQVVIQADSARVHTDFQHIVFTGNFSLTASDGETLLASQAVWSCKHKGFFFPNGLIRRNRQDNTPVFYDVMTSGRLVRRSPTVFVNYADPLEVKENELQEYIANDAPLSIRLLLGLTSLP